MSKNLNKITWIGKLLTNNWIITLTATLIGVLAAMYLNQQLAERNIENQKSIATANIITELDSNLKVLEKSIDKRRKLLETLLFLSAYVNEDGSLIVPPDSMYKFKRRHPTIVHLQDSIPVNNGLMKYEGEVNLDLIVTHLQLTTIAIETLKNSGINAAYDFECLMFLEKLDKLTKDVLKKDEMQWEYVQELKSMSEQNRPMISHIRSLINFEQSLIDYYSEGKSRLLECN